MPVYNNVTQTLDCTYPVLIKGYYDDAMLDFVIFVLTKKFQLKRPLNIEFKPPKTCAGCAGKYRSVDAGYTNLATEEVIVCTKYEQREVLKIIAHELRHVEQNHYGHYPTQKQMIQDYIDSFDNPDKYPGIVGGRKKIVQRQKEKDARDYELPTVNEFFAAQAT